MKGETSIIALRTEGDVLRKKRVVPKIYRLGAKRVKGLFCLALFTPSQSTLNHGLDAHSFTEIFHIAL